MSEIVELIFENLSTPRDNREYIDIIKKLEEKQLLLNKYYAGDKGAFFDLFGTKFNYRIYIDYIDDGKYLLEIRKKLAEIYKTYGIHWEISYKIDTYRIITIEEREKLKLCDEKDISCDELLLNWKKTLDILTEKLDLNNILLQIKNSITTYKRIDVKHLVLLRNKLVNAKDYAITLNNNAILLEDLDFVFCLTNYKGENIIFKGLRVNVNTTCGVFTLNTIGTTFNDKITHVYENQYMFFLYDYSCIDKYFNSTIENFDEMLKAQIDIYMDNDDVTAKYQQEYVSEYFNKLSNDRKYIILDTDLGENFLDSDERKKLY